MREENPATADEGMGVHKLHDCASRRRYAVPFTGAWYTRLPLPKGRCNLVSMKIDLPPVYTNHLFRGLARKLIRLLSALPPDKWHSATCYPHWTVHDIATHLLKTGLARLSGQRDAFKRLGARSFPSGFEELSEAIDVSNTIWTEAMFSASPAVIVDLLRLVEFQLAAYFARLGHSGDSSIGVGWAGEEKSPLWFDTAREFTERWHHQQQIRDAVGASPITQRTYLRPVILTLVRAAPYWYGSVIPSSPKAKLEIRIDGESGGIWVLEFEKAEWSLHEGRAEEQPDASVAMSADTAWRFLTRTISAAMAEPRMQFSGDPYLARHFLQVLSVMLPFDLR